MKATKNQANAVRSYLATLGLEISHVQALEVIARGNGHRSRHVKSAEPAVAPGAVSETANAFSKALDLQQQFSLGTLDLHTATGQLMDLFPELFDSSSSAADFLEQGTDESIGLHCAHVTLALELRDCYWAGNRSQQELAKALRDLVQNCNGLFKEYYSAYLFLSHDAAPVVESVSKAKSEPATVSQASPAKAHVCQVCDTALDSEGYCEDITCVYSDWPQSLDIGLVFNFPADEIERRTGIKKRVWYPDDQDALADAVKVGYECSGHQRSDLEQAVQRLMSECSDLFASEESAMAFLFENHKPAFVQTPDPKVLVVNSLLPGQLPGQKVHTYPLEEALQAGVLHQMVKGIEANDGFERHYIVGDSNGVTDPQALLDYVLGSGTGKLVGHITAAGEVHYQGRRIGTIKDLIADGRTPHDWLLANR